VTGFPRTGRGPDRDGPFDGRSVVSGPQDGFGTGNCEISDRDFDVGGHHPMRAAHQGASDFRIASSRETPSAGALLGGQHQLKGGVKRVAVDGDPFTPGEKSLQPRRNPWHDFHADAKRRIGHRDGARLGPPGCQSLPPAKCVVRVPGTLARNIYLVQGRN
jgi:hypothetical protein